MTRKFLYARVSTDDQDPQNQVLEVKTAGFDVAPHRVVTEVISGSVCAFSRPQFMRLIDRLESGDILIVTKLDRLGRNAIDVRGTVDRLQQLGIKVHCLALGGMDLTSAAGKMTMGVIATMAEFERDLLIERTQAGLKRARDAGTTCGRPAVLDDAQRAEIRKRLNEGAPVAKLAREYGVSRQTVSRARLQLIEQSSAPAHG